MTVNEPFLNVRELRKYFPLDRGLFNRGGGLVKAVDGVSFSIGGGETFSLIGESGCGKTTVARMVLLLETPTDGAVFWRGRNVHTLSGPQLASYRASVQAVFQDPRSALQPRMRIGDIVGEPLEVNTGLSRSEIRERVAKALESVGLSVADRQNFPHELSGGMQQRVAIARALALKPAIIVLDEPVSAVDVSIRAQILNLLKDIQSQQGVAYLFISHDLGTVRYMSHRVGIMYLGKLVEEATTEEAFSSPLHPYTKALLSAALPGHPDVKQEEIVLPGEVPSPIDTPSGCRFHPRCSYAMEVCHGVEPPLCEACSGHIVACHLYPAKP